MNKWIKRSLITGLVLMGAGLITAAAAAAMGGRIHGTMHWDHSGVRISHRETRQAEEPAQEPYTVPAQEPAQNQTQNPTQSPEQNPTQNPTQSPAPAQPTEQESSPSGSPAAYTFPVTEELKVDVDLGMVEILTSSDTSDIAVTVDDPYGLTWCYVEDQELKIRRELNRRRKNQSPDMNPGTDPVITIILPEGHVFRDAEIETGISSCSITGMNTAHLDLETDTGDISFQGTVTGDIEAETGVGNIWLRLTGSQTDYNYTGEADAGTITIDSQPLTSPEHEFRIHNNAPYTMDLESGTGSIDIIFN